MPKRLVKPDPVLAPTPTDPLSDGIHLLTASLTPSPTKMAPAARFKKCPDDGCSRRRRLIAEAPQTSVKHHNVPLKMNTPPRKRKERIRDSAVGATNWGRNARKKSATLGFRTF